MISDGTSRASATGARKNEPPSANIFCRNTGEKGNGETTDRFNLDGLGHSHFVVYGAENYANDKTNNECIDEADDASEKGNAVTGEEVRQQSQMRPHMWATFEHQEVGYQKQSHS